MNRAISQWGREGLVDQPVLLEQRQAVEARAHYHDLEVVAPAGPVLDGQRRVGKRVFEKTSQAFDGQEPIVAVKKLSSAPCAITVFA